jgi:hypothetical protein
MICSIDIVSSGSRPFLAPVLTPILTLAPTPAPARRGVKIDDHNIIAAISSFGSQNWIVGVVKLLGSSYLALKLTTPG